MILNASVTLRKLLCWINLSEVKNAKHVEEISQIYSNVKTLGELNKSLIFFFCNMELMHAYFAIKSILQYIWTFTNECMFIIYVKS